MHPFEIELIGRMRRDELQREAAAWRAAGVARSNDDYARRATQLIRRLAAHMRHRRPITA